MPKPLQKFIFSFLAFLVIFMSVAPNFMVAKAESWYSQSPAEWYLKVYDQSTSPPNEIFGERYTAAQVQWVIYGFLFFPIRIVASVVGDDIVSCFIQAVGTGVLNSNTCASGVVTTTRDLLKELFGKVFPSLSSTNNEPFLALVFDSRGRGLSGIGYTKNLLEKFTPVSEVYAQGAGYTGLTWIQAYWTGFRNISYGLLVIVVIVFAFMIMFRVKLSPQTVVSVQSALPKVIITMILITFSYAIAGFAVDLMYVVSGLFALLIKNAGFAPDTIFGATSVSAIFDAISGQGWAYNTPLGGLWILIEMLAYSVFFIISAFIALITSFLSGLNIFGALLGVVFMIVGALCFVMMIWYTFIIPFVLIKTLISVYITIITAPVQILAGALVPSMGFGSWFKRLMADILVFPVVGAFIWFAWATLWASYDNSLIDIGTSGSPFSASSWVPGIIGATGLSGKGGISGLIFLGISFGIMSSVAKVPDMLKGILLGEKFTFGNTLGEGVEGGLRAASSAVEVSKGVSEYSMRRAEFDKAHPKTPLTGSNKIPINMQSREGFDSE